MADYQPTSGRQISLHCIVCDAPYTYVTKARGRYVRFCSAVCREKRNKRTLVEIPCKTCGTMFLPRRVSREGRAKGLAAYCSLKCRPQSQPVDPVEKAALDRMHNQRSYARVKGAEVIERIDDREIFKRDGWRCGICKEPVDPNLKFPHHYAVCIDHIVPLAHGGQHVRTNLQCAHWLCNSLKGDRMPGAQGLEARPPTQPQV